MSDIGCVRETNEDRGAIRLPDAAETRAGRGALALVADGMGGHQAGEIASEMAVTLIEDAYYRSPQPPQAALVEAFHLANREIHRAAAQAPYWTGMGTTCTALVLRGNQAFSAQAGDSRLYLLRDGEVYLMSEDHSAVMEMVRLGKMSRAEARAHEDKNLLLRALGVQPEIRVSTWATPFPVRAGDAFLLCSDGLYDLVTDEELLLATAHGTPATASRRLIDLARERGGPDNITVAILQCRPETR